MKNDRIERTKTKYRELFGGTPIENEGTDAEFMKILQRFIFGEVFYTGTLSDQLREMITVTVNVINQTLPQLKAHVLAALNVKCTPIEIREAVYQCAPFIGFPKTLNAIKVMNEAFTESGVKLPLNNTATVTEDNRFIEGQKIQSPIYGTEIKDKYQYLPKEFAEAIPRFLTEFGFGDFYTRGGLDEKTRELLIFIALSALGGADLQVYSHAIGALKTGSSKETLMAALMQAMPYMGFPRMLNAVNAIKPLFTEQLS